MQLDAALTLDYVKLNGITLENGPLTIKDTVEVAGAVTLLNDTVTNTGATLQVDDGQTLTLSGTEIIGGTINDFSSTAGGKIDVTGDSKIDSGATLNNGAVTVESGVTLTLDNVTVNGTVFNDLVTGGTIQIDSGDALTFNGATINGGTLNISGELDSTGTSFITGATIVNSSHIDVVSGMLTIDPAPVTNTGTIEVKDDATLVLSEKSLPILTAPRRVSSRSMPPIPTHFCDARSGGVHDQGRDAHHRRRAGFDRRQLHHRR